MPTASISKKYLPAGNGGTMDAPLVLTLQIDPSEIDDEAHVMEICDSYGLEFYEAASRYASSGPFAIPSSRNVFAMGTSTNVGK